MDSQSVKNTDTAGHKGYDAGKKVSGIKRHIAVDTQGLPHAIHVTTADVTDRAGALAMFDRRRRYSTARTLAFLPRGSLYIVRKQREQILTRVGLPSMTNVCLCTFAIQRVLVLRLEWLTLLPVMPDFLQI